MAGYAADGTPSRPYSALGFGGSRTAEFATGHQGDSDSIATSAGQNPGLALNGQQFAAQVPHGVIQTSTLQPSNPVSANGMAADDYSRVLPGLSRPLPSPNGNSQDSYQKSLIMRLSGLGSQ